MYLKPFIIQYNFQVSNNRFYLHHVKLIIFVSISTIKIQKIDYVSREFSTSVLAAGTHVIIFDIHIFCI